jgi:hypothetical protein
LLFANRVIQDFRHVIGPLEDANHFSLTSLARAFIIVGKYTEGFDALRVLLQRHELPDTHDINVALSALAEYNPAGALDLIQRMYDKKLMPSSVTFGTIVHHAVVQKDAEVVAKAVEMAKSIGGGVSSKSVVTLIRASVAADEGAPGQGGTPKTLRLALDVMKSLAENELLVNSGTGKYLVYASLRAHDPVAAYKFWKLLVRDKAQWNDSEQSLLRRLIGRMVRKHVNRKWMKDDVGKVMLAQLREEREV